MRLHVIACPVFKPELELLAPAAEKQLTFRFLDMGLHEGASVNLQRALQSAIDEVAPGDCDTIALAYGLCNRGIVGLQARKHRLVVPRAHDCIGMLLGGTDCYLGQLQAQPGTYFQSAGWLEHLPGNGTLRQQNQAFGPGTTVSREQLVARYGEENADYLLEQFTALLRHYRRLAFISTPVPEVQKWEAGAQETAKQRGWTFERLEGDLGWLNRLINGPWADREFLQVRPGERIGLRHDGTLIGADCSAAQ